MPPRLRYWTSSLLQSFDLGAERENRDNSNFTSRVCEKSAHWCSRISCDCCLQPRRRCTTENHMI